MSPACQSVVLYYGCLDGGGAHKRKSAMHRSRNRLIQQGGFLTACAMGRNGFARVHGGESHGLVVQRATVQEVTSNTAENSANDGAANKAAYNSASNSGIGHRTNDTTDQGRVGIRGGLGLFAALLNQALFSIGQVHGLPLKATKSPGRRTGLENLSANPCGQHQKNKACGYEVGEHGSLRLVRVQIDIAHVPPAPAGKAQNAKHDKC